MKKLFMMLVFIVIFAVSPAQSKEKEINIALWKLPLNVPAMIALENRSYEKAFSGDRVVNYVTLPSGPKLIQAIAAGKLDIVEGLGAAAVLVGAANGVDVMIAGANSRAPRAFAILTNSPEIKTITDLSGKKAAGLRGSVVHQLFMELLEKNSINEKEVEFFPMPVSSATLALIARHVDAALLVGTEIKRAQNSGARILADGRGYVEGLSLIAVRTEFLKNNKDAVKKYLTAREKICRELSAYPDKFLPIIIKETGLSQKDAKDMLNMYDFDVNITKEDINELNKTINYLLKQGMVKSKTDIDELIWKGTFR